MDKYDLVNYENKKYAVLKITYQEFNLPVILDYDDFKTISKMDKNWRCSTNGFVSCSHTIDNIRKDVYLHELIMLLKIKDGELKKQNKSIIHINRVGLDNRRDNLMYDTINNDTNKNLKKKKRTIELPEGSGIDPDTIPTYIWYMKPDYSHGERFNINIGDVTWKTSSAKDLSLKYKLEEAKMFVRHIMRTRNDLAEEYSMNGDYTKDGKELLHTYYDIVHSAGYTNIKRFIPEHNTMDLLEPDYNNLTNYERQILSETRNWIRNEFK